MIIDINSDVGEGLGNEKDLFPYLSSCNIACGGHVGDASSIREIVLLSKTYQLKAGAHPSYPDPENFGRITMKYTKAHLIESIRNQLALISDILKEEGEELHHIKPHGALYNDVASDPEMAVTLLEAIAKFREDTILYVPYNSQIERLALEGGFMIWREAFGDRNYNDDLSLVPRKRNNALITSPEAVLNHILTILRDEKVKTISGKLMDIKADTICIHGDTPTAVKILEYLSKELAKFKISIAK